MELNKINFERPGMQSLLGELESDILEVLWSDGERNCRQVFDAVKKKHKVAYTTISVTLDRMHEKKLVERKVLRGKGGLSYRYSPKCSKEDIASRLSDQFLGFLKSTFGESSVAYLRKKARK